MSAIRFSSPVINTGLQPGAFLCARAISRFNGFVQVRGF